MFLVRQLCGSPVQLQTGENTLFQPFGPIFPEVFKHLDHDFCGELFINIGRTVHGFDSRHNADLMSMHGQYIIQKLGTYVIIFEIVL